MTTDAETIDLLCAELQKFKTDPREIEVEFERGIEEVPPIAGTAHMRNMRPDGSMTITVRIKKPLNT